MAEVSAQPLIQRAIPLPGSYGIGLIVTGAAAIAVLAAAFMWSQTPDYRVLYGNLSDRDGGAVIASLQQMNVPYKFADGGGALLVPANQVHEMRLRLAGQGLPKGGPAGFELMENQKFGTSQFAEQVNYQRGLEGELARSIQALAAVQGARVHLALAKSTAFMREQPKASASVLLNLHPGRRLDDTQVSAVVHLVSNSVPGLSAKNVTVVDQNGSLLSAETARSGRGALDPGQLRYRQEVEQGYISRIEAILAPLAGPNNVRAQVTADLDFSESEHAEETYKPNQNTQEAAVRSQQISEAGTGAAGTGAGGVPGALTNQPPVPATAPITGAAPGAAAPSAAAPSAAAPAAAAASANARKDSTINYEVDKTIKHTKQEVGRVKRLAVAVVVNHKSRTDAKGKVTQVALSAAEVEKLTTLVKEVVGYSKERGDTVSVMNSAFTTPEKEVIAEVPLWKQPGTIDLAKDIGKNVLVGAVLLFVVLFVLRPLLKTVAAARPAPQPLPSPADTPQLAQSGAIENGVERARRLAREDPKVVANVVKEWVSGDGK
ncbi:MAG TPA: flagellar basal-body MS-ring/collar protein FliF [Burkholderiales bacterium]|nr:flagellar basal-body MS-ring/collar protein FliF [Burkholderiales bacterium]